MFDFYLVPLLIYGHQQLIVVLNSILVITPFLVGSIADIDHTIAAFVTLCSLYPQTHPKHIMSATIVTSVNGRHAMYCPEISKTLTSPLYTGPRPSSFHRLFPWVDILALLFDFSSTLQTMLWGFKSRGQKLGL